MENRQEVKVKQSDSKNTMVLLLYITSKLLYKSEGLAGNQKIFTGNLAQPGKMGEAASCADRACGWPAKWGKRPAVQIEHAAGRPKWGKRPAAQMGESPGSPDPRQRMDVLAEAQPESLLL